MKKVMSSAVMTAVFFMMSMHLQAAPQPQAGCEALRDSESYGKKHEDFIYLLPGKDQWFFRTKQDLRSDYKISAKIVRQYKTFSDALKKKNIDLIITYAPTRGMSARAFLPEGDPLFHDYNSETAIRNYHDFIDFMNKSGISMVGFSKAAMDARHFYKADHHWSSAGAEEMAKAVAEKIKGLPSYKSIEKEEFATVKQNKKAVFKGSFNRILQSICGTETLPETDILTTTRLKNQVNSQATLFDNETFPEIVLVGTSNSKKEKNNVNFEGFLKQYLSADVHNASISGGGMDEPMLAYLASDSYREHPPKIIIWEIPGYYDFESKNARKLIQQAIPAAYGSCESTSLAERSAKISGNKLSLFSNQAFDPAQSYISLEFSRPIRKDFSLELNYADKKQETFKFTRTKLYPHDGIYYLLPKKIGTISSAELEFPNELQDVTLVSRICSFTPSQDRPSWFERLFDKWFS